MRTDTATDTTGKHNSCYNMRIVSHLHGTFSVLVYWWAKESPDKRNPV